MIRWTDDITARVLERYAKRAPMSVIANELGTTRNAIIGRLDRMRRQRDTAFLNADKQRGPRLNRTAQVAEWMAENDGRICDCARDIGFNPKATLKAWQRVCREMGAQAV